MGGDGEPPAPSRLSPPVRRAMSLPNSDHAERGVSHSSVLRSVGSKGESQRQHPGGWKEAEPAVGGNEGGNEGGRKERPGRSCAAHRRGWRQRQRCSLSLCLSLSLSLPPSPLHLPPPDRLTDCGDRPVPAATPTDGERNCNVRASTWERCCCKLASDLSHAGTSLVITDLNHCEHPRSHGETMSNLGCIHTRAV